MMFSSFDIRPLHALTAWCLLALLLLAPGCDSGDAGGGTEPGLPVAFWLSDAARSLKFAEQASGVEAGAAADAPTITVNPNTTYQTMDGFGFSLTGGSALHLHNMSAAARAALLQELFGTGAAAIGTSYLRISIGASDLDPAVFSYNDLPAGQTDVALDQFSIDPDRDHLIPVLKEILALAPHLKIMGSPWSAPAWMKTNGSPVGGNLKPEYYGVYAQYFVKYLQAMDAEGILIDAITVQNEPLHGGNNPSMEMSASAQAAFIRDHLGPAFAAAGLDTKIIIYDHNADRTDYPIAVLNDPDAKQYIDGSAFHLYGGDISALSQVHSIHPDRNLYFTEQWVGAPGNFGADLRWHIRELIIGASRNWCKVVLEWNLAADENQDPHTPGGCTKCLGAVTISGDAVTRNPAYYIIAHAAKFVRPGAVRVASEVPPGLPNVAFQNADGTRVVIVLNDGSAQAAFNLDFGGEVVQTRLGAGAVGTYVWSPS